MATSRLGGAIRGSLLAQLLVVAAALVLTLGGLLGITAVVQRPAVATPEPTANPYLLAYAAPAPDLRLTGTDGRPFDLADLRGAGVLVFFGYTHCPDVCPATTGVVGQVLDRYGAGLEGVFVSFDPERDTVEWLGEYERYLPPGYRAVTGTPEEVRATTDAWGAQYARVDGEDPGSYWFNHTATVYLVDGSGQLRAEFPFGTEPGPMLDTVRRVLGPGSPRGSPERTSSATAPPPPASASPAVPTHAQSAQPSEPIRVELISSSVWAGPASPVLIALYDQAGRVNDRSAVVRVRPTAPNGESVGGAVTATAVQPPGVADVSYLASIPFPRPGWWKIQVAVERGAARSVGTASVSALDPGGTAPLGDQAPSVPTPTLADAGGDATAVTTDPAPDLRLSQTSTVDALAARKPFVLVIDSTRFRTSPACGQAIILARFLLDRWPSVPVIHLEPFQYDVVSDTPVLRGTLSDPTLVPAAAAWGIGPAPWPATSMPWIFVVDGSGLVRAKYQGVIGSADIDVVLAQLTR